MSVEMYRTALGTRFAVRARVARTFQKGHEVITFRYSGRLLAAVAACAVLAAAQFGSAARAQYADVKFDSLKVGPEPRQVELAGVEFTGTSLSRDDIAKLFALDTPATDRAALAARLRAASISVATIKAFSPEDAVLTLTSFRATGVDQGKIARVTLGGGDLKPPPAETGFARAGALTIDSVDISTLLASLQSGTISIAGVKAARVSWNGFEALIPDEETPADAAGGNQIKISLTAFDAQSTFDGDTPLKLSGALRNLVVELPRASASGQQLAALGIERLDLGVTFAGGYDLAKKAVNLDDLTVTVVGLGALGLRAQLGNLDPAALKGDREKALGALMGAELASLDLSVANAGFFAKLLAFVGQQEGKTPDALKAEWTAMTGIMLPMVLGDPQIGARLAGAVGGFIRDAKSLTVSIKGKNGPVKIATINPGDPMSLLALVTITATNEGGSLAPRAAAPAPATPPAAAPRPQAGAPATRKLTGLEAINALVGNTISGRNSDGDPFFQYYLRNGSVKELDDDQKDEGTWVARGQQICVEMDHDDEETCYAIEVAGNAAKFTSEDGTVFRYTILQGNPKRL